MLEGWLLQKAEPKHASVSVLRASSADMDGELGRLR
jgi:hypothetical protein